MESDDSNILDAETINWRLIVYPILAVLVIGVGGFGYYYYLQYQREALEAKAREALVGAKTPEELVKVADQFPRTDQATLALLGAADGSFAKRDYAGAIADYQRIVQAATTNPDLLDPAQLGLASSLEAGGKMDDAINAYLEVARRGAKSPYAPFAYYAAANLYEARGDKTNEREVLTEAAMLDPDSAFVKQAQAKLKELTMAAQVPTTNVVPAAAPVSAPTPNQK